MSLSATVMRRDEAERVKALLAYEILDTLPDPALDEIARLAATLSGAPYAFIGLMDWSRVWFKSRIGFAASQVPSAGSAFQIAVSEADSLLIGDAALDSRFAPAGISLGDSLCCRSYAAAPLIDSAGSILGVLGAASPDPHFFNQSILATVEILARQAVTRMELYARGSRQEHALRDLRQAERELTRERNFVAAILDSTNALVVVLDADGRVIRINHAGERTSGLRLEDLAGRVFPGEIWPAEHRKAAIELFEHARSGKPSPPREMTSVSPAGERRTITWSAMTMVSAPASSAPGGARHTAGFVIMTGVDITARVESEEQLHAVMRQRETILESVEDGIWGIDLNGRLAFINPSGAAMLGYTRQELLGKDFHALVHHSHKDGSPYPEVECPILLSLKSGTSVRISSDFFWRKDGSPFAVEYAACPLMDGGQARGTVIAFQDVSRRLRLDRMKDEFISTVSHELRTPLTSLRAALGLVTGGALANRPEKIPEMLGVAMTNCDRLVRLVNDIVDFERIQAESQPVERAETSAVDLVSRSMDAEQPDAVRAGLSFRIDAQPVKVLVDEELILKVLRKLIQNAVKFSRRGGEIRLSVSPANNQEATFAVEDHGCGIDAENLTRIFDRFHQADASDTRASGGAGLGLAICRSIISRHGGRIWAESIEGQGSTFFFTVPRALDSAAEPSQDS